jgi:plastocyanin
VRRWYSLFVVAGVCAVGLAGTAAAAVALAKPQSAQQQTRLIAIVGPDYNISLTHENGTRVTRLDPGTYEITVHDRSDIHNFALRGPGVNRSTGIDFTGTVTWTVTLQQGTYTYVCDPHSYDMTGSFVVGTPASPAPPPAPPPQPDRRLVATVGPGNTIAVQTPGGAVVRQTPAGAYTITVRDRSRTHNFHLIGPGVNRRTTVPFVGTQTWRVQLRAGQLYRFQSTPQAPFVQGAFVVGTPRPAIRRLVATVGPGATIAVRTPGGQLVRSTPAGIYQITVRDLSAMHNFRLIGPGVNLATRVPFRGTQTWLVQLRRGATYTFRCDPHLRHMRGTIRAT